MKTVLREATKDEILTAYTERVVDTMTLEEIKEELVDFIYSDMHPLPKSEILEYVDSICPEIIEEG